MSNLDSDPAPTRREREQARHRQDILAAAVSLFADNGYYQTTMQMIAERAEFSVGYLYKHFPGKEEMYQELVRYHSARMGELIAEAKAANLSPLEELRHSYEAVSHHFNRHRDFMRIFHQEIGGECGELLETKKAHFDNLVEALSRAQEAGQLKPYDPAILAAAMQGATKELFGELAERPGENPFDGLTDTLFSLLVDPLRK